MSTGLTYCLHHATKALTHLYTRITGAEKRAARQQRTYLQREAQRLDDAYGLISPEDCEDIPPNWFDTLGNEFLATHRGYYVPREERIQELKNIHLERLVNYEMERRGVEECSPMSDESS